MKAAAQHSRARSRVLRADDVRRARLILMLAEGHSWSAIQTDGSTHWSSRKLARTLGVNHMMVARVWRRARA